jgi:hypothetical protein
VSGFAAIIGRLSDRVNPIVVKELRQAVRSRIVTGIFIFFLVVQFAIVALALLLDDSAATSLSAGRSLAAALYSFMMFVCIVFVPLYSGLRLAWERSDARRDLMFATTISAGAIVRGKMLTAAMIVALIYSACAPFMVFTYLLRGIDLPTIFAMLGLGALYVLGVVQFALFLACIPTSRVAKIFLGLFGLVVILWMVGGMVATFSMMLVGPSSFLMFTPGGGPWGYWGAIVSGLALSALVIGWLHFVSVAILKPPSANRMLPVRVYVTAVWLVGGAVAVVWSVLVLDKDPIEVWAVLSALFFAGALLVAVSERETWGPRVRRRIPRFLPARAVAFLFFSGGAGGVLWAFSALCLTGLAVYLVAPGYPALLWGWDGVPVISAGIALYALAYALTAGLVRRLLVRLGARFPHYYTWVLALALATFGSVAPLLVFLVLTYGSRDWSRLMLGASPLTYLNPVYLDESAGRDARLAFVGLWAAVVTAASIPWFLRQVRAFRPLRSEPAPAPDGARHG